jgi:predicted deacylase
LPGEVIRIDPKRESPPRYVEAPDLDAYVPCPRDGIWEPAVSPSMDVREGTLIGRLHDFADHSSAALAIHAQRAGIVIALYFGASVKKGLAVEVDEAALEKYRIKI